MMVKVLFLHSSWVIASEYVVHRSLAEHADPALVDSYFVWQQDTVDLGMQTGPKLSQPGRTWFFDFGRDLKQMGGHPRPIRLQAVLRRLPAAMHFVGERIRAIRPHVIYTSQQRHEAILGAMLSRRFGVPHCIHISYPFEDCLGWHARTIIRHTPRLIACSEFVRQSIIAGGVRPEYLTTLYHGADVSSFLIPPDPAGLRRQFGWPDDALVVIAAARLDPNKGHMLLLEAFARVRAQLPNARLLLCGESFLTPGYDKLIRRRATSLNLDDAVVFAGQRSDLPQLFAGSNLFCLPTEDDALPLVFIMAMAAGLATVACRSGGVPELVSHGQTGLLSELGAPEALATNMIRLLQDPALAARMGEAGRRIAATAFHPERIATQWAKLLHQWFAAA